MSAETKRIRDALELLGVRRLLLGIHDAAFPSRADDDTGRGTPCSPAARELLAFVAELGFTGIQLGPQGSTSEINPSPYDGTLFSRSDLSVSLARLADEHGPFAGLLPRSALERAVAARPAGAEERVPHGHVHRIHREALGAAFETLRREATQRAPLLAQLETFVGRNAYWLEPDALFEAVRLEHQGISWTEWPAEGPLGLDRRLLAPRPDEVARARARRREIETRYPPLMDFYRFCQWLAHAQHEALRADAAQLGLRLQGDLQIGISRRDAWARQELLLRGYRLGAPPSRTNPEGQPWGYPVLDPSSYGRPGSPGAALEFVTARLDKAFGEYDGVRIDHPHGLVCPWVYRAEQSDPHAAVRGGARLFASPDLADHPELACFSIARRQDLSADPATPRHADDWVVSLTPEQVDRYAVLIDVLVEVAGRRGRETADLVCEVLSTLPYPLARVLERHGLGRLRVTQKADLDDPDDVYRSENAAPEDWIMVGNHDTPTVWGLLPIWEREGRLGQRAHYLARRLAPDPATRSELAAQLTASPARLVEALFADLFASPARNVMIFFGDLFGLTEPFNRPGTVDPTNWSARLAHDWRDRWRAALGAGSVVDLRSALALALRARGQREPHATLAAALERDARRPAG